MPTPSELGRAGGHGRTDEPQRRRPSGRSSGKVLRTPGNDSFRLLAWPSRWLPCRADEHQRRCPVAERLTKAMENPQSEFSERMLRLAEALAAPLRRWSQRRRLFGRASGKGPENPGKSSFCVLNLAGRC
jgi:hypothetical protein